MRVGLYEIEDLVFSIRLHGINVAENLEIICEDELSSFSSLDGALFIFKHDSYDYVVYVDDWIDEKSALETMYSWAKDSCMQKIKIIELIPESEEHLESKCLGNPLYLGKILYAKN